MGDTRSTNRKIALVAVNINPNAMMMMRKTVKTNRLTTTNLLDNKVNVSICFYIHVIYIEYTLVHLILYKQQVNQTGRMSETLTQTEESPSQADNQDAHTRQFSLQIVIVTQIRAMRD